jgi:anhydro-N-acetylmuramic acid kinase
MARLFGDSRESRLIVNLGGVANYFYIPAGSRFERLAAADCGPGNMLIDALAARLYQQPYDRNGALARHGAIYEPIVRELLRFVNISRRGHRSAGREEFGEPLLNRLLTLGNQQTLTDPDLIATASEVTVRSIVRCLMPFVRANTVLTKLYLTGGGAHNKFIRDRLSTHLPMLSIVPIDTLGLPAGLVEAAAFAVLGEAALRSEALPTRFDGNARQSRWPVSGRIAQPPVKQR